MISRSNIEPHFSPDMAGEADRNSVAQLMADAFEMPLAEALSICSRFSADGLHEETQVDKLAEVVAWLIKPCRNLPAKVLGLACSFGIVDVVNGNRLLGIGSMADEARMRGLSRADISHWKREADKKFNRYGRVFGKSPEACEKNRTARLKVLRKQKLTTNGH